MHVTGAVCMTFWSIDQLLSDLQASAIKIWYILLHAI